MMLFSTLLSVACLSGGALAAPAAAINKRGSIVYITTDPFWGYRETSGLHRTFEVQGFDQCVDLQGSPFDKAISSFGPAQGVECVVFDGYNCQGASEPIWYSGYADMGWNGWNNRVSSYQCGYCTPGVDRGCL